MKYLSELSFVKVFDAEAVAKSGSATSVEISTSNVEGFFCLQWEVTGDGTVKFEVLPSNNGDDFLDTEPDIATGQTKTSGPGSNGKNLVSFGIPPCRSFKIMATETGGSKSVTVSAWLKAQ